MRIPYLFDPAAVEAELSQFASLSNAVKPANEGVSASAFAGVRKSERQLYRILGNTHYPHLVELLEALDACMQRGFSQPRLLDTRSRFAFAPVLAELRVAEHFVLADGAIEGFDDSKAQEPVPDLVVTTPGGFTLAVEVYCPMAFENLERFKDDVVSGIKNLDVPYDFVFRLEFEKLVDFDPDTKRLVYLLPDQLDAQLSGGRRDVIVKALLDEVVENLGRAAVQSCVRQDETDLNLCIAIDVDGVEECTQGLPSRAGVIGGPSPAVPPPEWVFRRIVERTEKKAREGQALRCGSDAAVLVVDLTEADLPSELRNDIYRQKFRDILSPRADQALEGHAAIVFVESAGWHKPFIPWFLNTAPAAPKELFELLDPRRIYARPSS